MKPPDRVEPGTCDCCGFGPVPLTVTNAYARGPAHHGPFTPDDEVEWSELCDVCRSSPAGNSYLYPRQYDEHTRLILQQIAYGTNATIAAAARG